MPGYLGRSRKVTFFKKDAFYKLSMIQNVVFKNSCFPVGMNVKEAIKCTHTVHKSTAHLTIFLLS